MRTLNLVDSDGLYSNLALLLSDQCTHTIKAAVFQGNDQTVFKDRREFSGSLMQQMNEVYDFIDFHNQTYATIEKLHRIDSRDYPEVAIREALLNLLVHRDYAFSASALISIYSDRMEFISIGGLMPGIDLEDVMAGISICRNQNLANIFYRLHLIEAYGTGMSKIINAYKDMPKKPVIETTGNTFKIILPNSNYKADGITASEAADVDNNDILSASEHLILEYVKKHSKTKKTDIAKLLNVSSSTALRSIRKLISLNMLKQHGKAKNTYYTII